jgi:hypothetical protein
MSDRTIHAVCEDGRAIVRYDRAGRWYIEHGTKRRPVSVREAADVAVQAWRGLGVVYLGLPGGGAFDAKVRREVEAAPAPDPEARRARRVGEEGPTTPVPVDDDHPEAKDRP